MSIDDKIKVWALSKISQSCDCDTFNYINFDVLGVEPSLLTNEEYNAMLTGVQRLPYNSQQTFVFLIRHPDASRSNSELITESNVVQKAVEKGKKFAIAQKDAERKASEKAKAAAAKENVRRKRRNLNCTNR